LRKGTIGHEVEQILGPPQGTRSVSKFRYWYYGQGQVKFYQGRLKSFITP